MARNDEFEHLGGVIDHYRNQVPPPAQLIPTPPAKSGDKIDRQQTHQITTHKQGKTAKQAFIASAMAPSLIPILDHVVILVPHAFLASPPPWLTDLFTLYPGGRHADGLTENTLVLFADGSYLEFIAFIPGRDRGAHRWGRKQEGTVVDWALTLEDPGAAGDTTSWARREQAFRDVRHRVRDTRAGIAYGDLVRGGRTKPDGRELGWAVAAPEGEGAEAEAQAGVVPFWCLDVTPRHLRVPYAEPGVADHPCGAVGVARVSSLVRGQGEAARGVYDVLFGEGEVERGNRVSWTVETLSGKGIHSPSRVSIGGVDEGGPPGISIALFTDREVPGNKEVGGRVDGEHSLVFALVGPAGHST
ncbi:glyoxalase-like domain-containing protein [Xylariaceae sp. FL0662B]|nr:glyoxalase-like domain-containing protein [Xylariaceae sp. FL0662B]